MVRIDRPDHFPVANRFVPAPCLHGLQATAVQVVDFAAALGRKSRFGHGGRCRNGRLVQQRPVWRPGFRAGPVHWRPPPIRVRRNRAEGRRPGDCGPSFNWPAWARLTALFTQGGGPPGHGGLGPGKHGGGVLVLGGQPQNVGESGTGGDQVVVGEGVQGRFVARLDVPRAGRPQVTLGFHAGEPGAGLGMARCRGQGPAPAQGRADQISLFFLLLRETGIGLGRHGSQDPADPGPTPSGCRSCSVHRPSVADSRA